MAALDDMIDAIFNQISIVAHCAATDIEGPQ
jgi:hypothetical protein